MPKISSGGHSICEPPDSIDKRNTSSGISRRSLLLTGSGFVGSLGATSAYPNPIMGGLNYSVGSKRGVPPGLVLAEYSAPPSQNRSAPLGANPSAPSSISVTPLAGENSITEYPFNSSHVFGVLVSNLHEFDTADLFAQQDNKDIVLTNLGAQHVLVSGLDESNTLPLEATPLKRSLPPLQSLVVRAGVTISTSDASATGLVSLMQVRTPRNAQTDTFADTTLWSQYQYPNGMAPLPLWISNQIHLAKPVELDPWAMAGLQAPINAKPLDYELYANLWWLPAGSDAGIHAAHHRNFLEVHTQLTGFGRMQKFRDLDTPQAGSGERPLLLPVGGDMTPFDTGDAFPGLYEETRLAPGATHLPMPLVTEYDAWDTQSDIARNASIDDPCFFYPPHQYYADTDCLWIAFEFHRAL
ncbi:hypothetical protein [uncultured Celeribacter sp.]|uniref:hypothetical protein n=1 Tax=uncultured Celeribacter sp. TaxID=1303376 RepID=UPI002AA5ECCE|nr:hypothetical protein [uncultured Celeribacter sp.]